MLNVMLDKKQAKRAFGMNIYIYFKPIESCTVYILKELKRVRKNFPMFKSVRQTFIRLIIRLNSDLCECELLSRRMFPKTDITRYYGAGKSMNE